MPFARCMHGAEVTMWHHLTAHTGGAHHADGTGATPVRGQLEVGVTIR